MEPPSELQDAATIAVDTLAAATATFIAAVSPTPTADASSTSTEESQPGECRLMGPFALVVQAALGALALLSLVFKRWRERPQRPVKIWFFDVSKQVFGSVLVHIANIFMSMLTSGRFSVQVEPGKAGKMMVRDDEYVPNPCSFYLLNLAIDTTIGIPILIVLLKVVTGLVAYTPLGKPRESIQSGYYGHPPSAWWWLKQSIIYFIGLFGMKLVVLLMFLILPWISKIGDWALGWTEGNEKLQIAFVMMIFPLIMNALQYYIIDSFIKEKKQMDDHHDGHERVPSEDPDERRRLHHGENEGGEDVLTSSEDEEDDVKNSGRHKKQRRHSRPDEDVEYDPDKDGEARTVVESSSSSQRFEPPNKHVQPELYPKE